MMRGSTAPLAAMSLAILIVHSAAGAEPERSWPQPAAGWSIEPASEIPLAGQPTALAGSPDGTLYVALHRPAQPGFVLAIQDGKSRVFADGLGVVSGLEWIDGTLYVLHPPELSAIRDTDRDGRADQRVTLVSGLGPKPVAALGVSDHIVAGLRAGIDGFLYMAVGDRGIARARGADGKTLALVGGGVIRVRSDGRGIEVVSTGSRKPRLHLHELHGRGLHPGRLPGRRTLARWIDAPHRGRPLRLPVRLPHRTDALLAAGRWRLRRARGRGRLVRQARAARPQFRHHPGL